MIKISVKGLAKFMTSSAVTQRKILRDYKSLDPEGRAQVIYYRESRNYISAFHKNDRDTNWLIEKADNLAESSRVADGQKKIRLNHNARALRQYANYFGHKKLEILPNMKLVLMFSDVRISIYPDLHIRENGQEKIVKLEFSSDAPTPQAIKIISQAMFEAVSNVGLNLPSGNVLYADVPRGTLHKGARVGARMRKEIEAACENIRAIWDSI